VCTFSEVFSRKINISLSCSHFKLIELVDAIKPNNNFDALTNWKHSKDHPNQEKVEQLEDKLD
jgi:hypothetical protein